MVIFSAWITQIIVSPTGSVAFNEKPGQLTMLSYPVNAIPCMFMMMIFYYLWRTIFSLTGLALDDVLASKGLKDEKYD